jgi:hypothetical protein
VTRVKDPYPFASLSWADVNANARGALVNILCMPHGGSLQPISGSGVIIDPRGVILTNAHVGQYVLLSESTQVDLVCVIRTGSPAVARYKAAVLYIPPVWVEKHVGEITTPHPLGTGEHDYALLVITGSADGSPLPATFPALPYDTRKSIAFQGDQILAASYPAEFLGGLSTGSSLYSASSITRIEQLQAFGSGSPDVISLGGIIEAQSGSSGGDVVNAWGRLVGLIVTTSQGQTTAQRDLHALSLFYIDSDLTAQTGSGLAATLSDDLSAKAQDFTDTTARSLIRQYIKVLTK